jgi:hypothetical protein
VKPVGLRGSAYEFILPNLAQPFKVSPPKCRLLHRLPPRALAPFRRKVSLESSENETGCHFLAAPADIESEYFLLSFIRRSAYSNTLSSKIEM